MLTQQQRLAGLSIDMAQRAVAIAQAMEQGRLDEAERGVIAALALAPKHPEILRLFGMSQFLRGRNDEAIDTLLQARGQQPDDPMIHNALGGAYEAVMDYTRARESLRRACDLAPDLAPCWFNLGKRLFVDGDIEGAIPVLQRVVELAPQHVYARTHLANVLRADGRSAEAAAQYRAIIAQNPAGAGLAWWGLATLKPAALGAADIAPMQQILRGAGGSENDRIAVGFALANLFEQQGDFTAAFALLQQTHARARLSERYPAGDVSARLDSILGTFSLPPPGAEPAAGDEVIFIVSLPRSGSTLTEQILASHSQVEGSSELPDLGQIIMDESDRRRQAFPHWVGKVTPDEWHALGQQYLARTERWRRQRPRFTDKMPGNWQYVGAILAMLPRARVIICRRDPLETCLGCYRYLFNHHAYTHDFSDLASHWRDFDRAARRWKQLYPDRVREQVYEDLQADPETQIRELLAFCNLPFEEQCLNFHSTERRVTTPSAAQVREPMRRDTARAAKYGALLDPLRSALGMPLFRGE
jgi:tetratricopeptide (TPR) repeat protein